MGKREKKTGKGRLDKYYKLAKEQGYRARSAFKLIQLDKKFNFLERSRCVIDLCAAPGGWLQVASKYMPPDSIIVGVDLTPIKPIPRCVTFVEDITTPACRTKLRAEVKDWKADVVLHDGAPNVGTAWAQDAFTQAELVLSSLKLATEFLISGGTFVTKIFRSKDYNSLLWVFNQLFQKVEATKPPSSRNVSAEIFVVCSGYLAPKRIDPKLLSGAHVFKDLDVVAAPVDGEEPNNKLTAHAQNIFHPEKKRRKREGYEEGDYTLFKLVPVEEFVMGRLDPLKVLAEASKFDFTTEQGKKLAESNLTSADVKIACEDLKVLGKKDFKTLLKWRVAIREQMGLEAKVQSTAEVVETADVEPVDEEEQMQQELERLTAADQARRRRDRRRVNERKARDVLKLQLNMGTPMDVGLNRADGDTDMFDLNLVDGKGKAKALDQDAGMNMFGEEPAEYDLGSGEEEDLPSDEEELRMHMLEGNMDELYDEFQNRRLERDAKATARANRMKKHIAEGGEFGGIGQDKQSDSEEEANSGDEVVQLPTSDVSSDEEDDAEAAPQVGKKRARNGKLISDLQDADVAATQKDRAAAIWYDQKVFKGVKGLDALLKADESEEEEDKIEEVAPSTRSKKLPQISQDVLEWSSDEEGPASDVEEVPLVDEQALEDASKLRAQQLGITTAEAYTLASQLVNREKTKSQLIDEGFNRHAFLDKDGLPPWFLDDEMKHFRANLPVTKEAVNALRARDRAMNARPIKKIAEAKARKKIRANRRLTRMQKNAEVINENADMTEKEKSSSIAKLVNKASKDPKKKSEVKVVYAKGSNKGNKGRPNGVKGRYKMVDSRGLKEVRALKRIAKQKKKGRRK